MATHSLRSSALMMLLTIMCPCNSLQFRNIGKPKGSTPTTFRPVDHPRCRAGHLPSFAPSFDRTYSIHHSSRGEGLTIRSQKEKFLRCTPLWTVMAAGIATLQPSLVSATMGDIQSMQVALGVLMMSMGLTITPKQLKNASQQPIVIALNILCCFALMPLLALGIARGLHFTSPQTTGTVLLGCVSGGQASNLFTLLAGGDVALSVICTLSTTILGTILTPLLVKVLLGASVATDPTAMLQSAARFVLVPLSAGLLLGQLSNQRQRTFFQRFCPIVGVLATLVLVTGGAANAASSSSAGWKASSYAWKATLGATVGLPILGGLLSSLLIRPFSNIPQASKRTLVIEVLSKSPTLAHVLALKHFGASAATLPATAMVSLAVIGAFQASIYSRIPMD